MEELFSLCIMSSRSLGFLKLQETSWSVQKYRDRALTVILLLLVVSSPDAFLLKDTLGLR